MKFVSACLKGGASVGVQSRRSAGAGKMPSGGARRVAERGGQPDKDQQEQDEGHGNERREEERRERENEDLRARLDRLSNALDAQGEVTIDAPAWRSPLRTLPKA